MGHYSYQPFPEYGRRRQELIFVHGLGHKVSRVPADFPALEERARRVMTKRGFAYVAGGAGNERTMIANRAAFDRWRIVPRVLAGFHLFAVGHLQQAGKTTRLGPARPFVRAPDGDSAGYLLLSHSTCTRGY